MNLNYSPDQQPSAQAPAAYAGWTLPEALQELPAELAAGLVGQLIEPFQTDTARRLGRVRRAIGDANLAALHAEIHSLKGSAGQAGAHRMASICQEMESAIGDLPASQLLDCVSRLELDCAAAVLAMTAYSAAAQMAAGERD